MMSDSGISVVRVGDWAGYEWLRHGFSTRVGGVSTVYGDGALNLGWTKEDDAERVAENRRRFLRAVTGEMPSEAGMRLVTIRQVHSGVSQVVRAGDGAVEGRLETVEGKAVLEGDGLMTDVPGVMLGVGTADCVPVLVADGRKRVVAAFHAGWRGTVARIVERGVARMGEEYGSRPEDLVAAVGPSIGACCYSVGEEVRGVGTRDEVYARASHDAPLRDDETVAKRGHPASGAGLYLDLWEANRRQLLDAGLRAEQISVVGECTACVRNGRGERSYFSHRAERGVAGRMLSVVGILG